MEIAKIILFYTFKSCTKPTRIGSYKLDKFDISFKTGLGIIFYNFIVSIVRVQNVGLVRIYTSCIVVEIHFKSNKL